MVGHMRFDQIKIIARDIESLSSFYQEALGCEAVVSSFEVVDEAVARAIGVPGNAVTLSILRLPGRGDHGPVLELYSIGGGEMPDDWHYQPGQGQMAFEVDDVDVKAAALVDKGATMLGEPVDWVGPSGSTARFVYLRDPEGNIIDIWSRVD